MGFTVEWFPENQMIRMRNTEGEEVLLQIGYPQFQVRGEMVDLDVPAQIINDRTMLPLRAIVEALEAQVEWNQEERLVSIYWQDDTPPPSEEISAITPVQQAVKDFVIAQGDVHEFLANHLTEYPVIVVDGVPMAVPKDGTIHLGGTPTTGAVRSKAQTRTLNSVRVNPLINFVEMEYVEVQQYPKIILAKSDDAESILVEYMKNRGFDEDESGRMGEILRFENEFISQYVLFSSNPLFSKWTWRE